MIYIIGSLRNPRIPEIANALRADGHDAYDDWYSPGPEADDYWQKYERARGRSYQEAIRGHHARHVFENDREHLEQCNAGILVGPAGKSAHMELGWLAGRGKWTYVLLEEEPERYDIMYRFADGLYTDFAELRSHLRRMLLDPTYIRRG